MQKILKSTTRTTFLIMTKICQLLEFHLPICHAFPFICIFSFLFQYRKVILQQIARMSSAIRYCGALNRHLALAYRQAGQSAYSKPCNLLAVQAYQHKYDIRTFKNFGHKRHRPLPRFTKIFWVIIGGGMVASGLDWERYVVLKLIEGFPFDLKKRITGINETSVTHKST